MVSATLLRWIHENRKSIAIGILIVLVLLCWIRYDAGRNTDTYDNTNDTVERIDKRIDDAEQRLERMQERNQQSQEAVTGIAESITDSRKQSETIAGSVDRAEQRLDSATQRLGRIQNIIADIERTNQ